TGIAQLGLHVLRQLRHLPRHDLGLSHLQEILGLARQLPVACWPIPFALFHLPAVQLGTGAAAAAPGQSPAVDGLVLPLLATSALDLDRVGEEDAAYSTPRDRETPERVLHGHAVVVGDNPRPQGAGVHQAGNRQQPERELEGYVVMAL